MSALTIRHTHAEGTTLDGASKADQVGAVLKSLGYIGTRWRWWRDGGVWYIQGSRDRRADRARIESARDALVAAGHTVEIEVDDLARRSVAEQEADRRERSAARVEGLTAKAERLEGQSDARYATAKELGEHIPMGQPVLAGHHSEGRHRRLLARIDANYGKAFELHREATSANQRAGAAAANQRHRENVGTVRRRLDKLQADYRRAERNDRDDLLPELDEKITYWTAFLEQLERAGVKLWSREDFQVGDYIREGRYRTAGPVKRVNAKSVSVPHPFEQLAAYSWTVSYDKITGRYRPGVDPTFAEQDKAAAAAAAEVEEEPAEEPMVEDPSEREDRAPFWSDSVY